MSHWREEELERLKKEYAFYKETDSLRSQTLKWVIDYHERMLGIKFWGEDLINQNGDHPRHQNTNSST